MANNTESGYRIILNPNLCNACGPVGINLALSLFAIANAISSEDGSPRIIKIGKRNIKFKIASPKLLSVKNETNIHIIQALRELGKENINEGVKSKIAHILKNVDPEQLKHDIKLAPRWIADIMQNSL